MTAMMLVNISTDMPLPTPRSVISSPIHMITAVPDTIVITIVAMVTGVGSGISGWNAGPQPLPENTAPVRAAWTYATAYRRGQFGAEPEHDDHGAGEQQLLTQVRRAERLDEHAQHGRGAQVAA